tara:strand:+ start:69 stop:1181 length:1113 start_codon:yes stop_codon:yes gene_type:complete
MKTCFIFSTRPEIIKFASLIQLFSKNKENFFIINTMQHYDDLLSKIFFNALKIKKPKYNLIDNKKSSSTDFFSKSLNDIEKILKKEKPDNLIIQGDTNTSLVGALAGQFFNRNSHLYKKEIKIIHLEAGLRSFDKTMPEEINRRIIDQVSDVLLVPTKFDYKNLNKENLVNEKKVYVTGNTITDIIKISLKEIKHNKILQSLKLQKKMYYLVTIHRPENTNSLRKLKKIILNLDKIGQIYNKDIIFPAHLRTIKKINQMKMQKLKKVRIIDPLNYYDFLKLEKESKIIITDSGGIQEEASILRVPCITIRKNTERQVTIQKKINILSNTTYKKLLSCVKIMNKKKINDLKLFGNGKVAQEVYRKIIKDQK